MLVLYVHVAPAPIKCAHTRAMPPPAVIVPTRVSHPPHYNKHAHVGTYLARELGDDYVADVVHRVPGSAMHVLLQVPACEGRMGVWARRVVRWVQRPQFDEGASCQLDQAWRRCSIHTPWLTARLIREVGKWLRCGVLGRPVRLLAM